MSKTSLAVSLLCVQNNQTYKHSIYYVHVCNVKHKTWISRATWGNGHILGLPSHQKPPPFAIRDGVNAISFIHGHQLQHSLNGELCNDRVCMHTASQRASLHQDKSMNRRPTDRTTDEKFNFGIGIMHEKSISEPSTLNDKNVILCRVLPAE